MAVRSEQSFAVHLPIAGVVLLLSTLLKLSQVEWCLILFAIAMVLSAEVMNSSIERIARAITDEQHADIRDALDMASGAVLVVASGAAAVGLIVFVKAILAAWESYLA